MSSKSACDAVFKKLVGISLVSANLGYTLFLFPLLGALYGDWVPFTVSNLVVFMLVDSFGGILLAVVSYLAMRFGNMSITRSITLSVTLLWTTYWLITVCATEGSGSISGDVVIVCLDGLAALITWASLTMLAKNFIGRKS